MSTSHCQHKIFVATEIRLAASDQARASMWNSIRILQCAGNDLIHVGPGFGHMNAKV
jgi:hypothetical protein